jgi:hypothetical protein
VQDREGAIGPPPFPGKIVVLPGIVARQDAHGFERGTTPR